MTDGIFFVFVFLPAVLAVYYLVPSRCRTARNIVLFAAGLFFCGYAKPMYLLLLVFSTVCTYFLGIWIEERIFANEVHEARQLLSFGTVLFVVILGFFCYSGIFSRLFVSAGIGAFSFIELLFPVGITVYVLQALSYLTDVYRGTVKAEDRYLNIALSMAFFPLMTAGPIMRYSETGKQIADRRESFIKAGRGSCLFLTGLCKLTVLSAMAGNLWTAVSAMEPKDMSAVTAWTGAAAVMFQIYFAFSGWADMAVGIGRMFGFEFRKNFDYPLLSLSVSEFFEKWNKTLIDWFHDYVFVPFFGRGGDGQAIFGIFVTAALIGFWHGSGFRCAVCGVYFAAIVLLEVYVWGRLLARCNRYVRRLYTVVLVMIGFVVFAAPSLRSGIAYVTAMFGGGSGFADGAGGYYLRTNLLLFIIMIIASTSWGRKAMDGLIDKYKSRGTLAAVVYYAVILLISVAFMTAGKDAVFEFFRY